MPIKDDSLVAQYIRAIENPDSVGFNNGRWEAPPAGKGYDLNSRGFGMDVNYNDATRDLTANRNGKWLTEEEERRLRIDHMKDNQKTLNKWTASPYIRRNPLTEEKEAMALGMLYRGDGIKSIIRNSAIRDAYYSGSDEDMQKVVSNFYQKKYPQRAENHNQFLNSRKPSNSQFSKSKFEQYEFTPKFKFAEGGDLDDNYWNNLSMKDKVEMMKVAIANGITTLPEIRLAYNEFAKGGKMNTWTMQDEAGYRHWRQNLPRNLRETNDNDYDMRAAYKAGMQPEWDEDDKSYHLGSRDPKSGRILKSPHHPTFLKALIEDATMGYYPTTDRNGNTYTSTWKANEFADGGQKDSYIDADDRRHKVLLETRNGNLYDNNGNNYTQSYLDESNVPVIIGTMPRDTSRYYDPNTTLEFINVATAPISNFSPSNIVGSIRKAEDYPTFMSSFMNQDNNGFFTDNFAKEHPVATGIGNLAGDLAFGAAFDKGFDFLKSSLTNAKYSKRAYTKLAEEYLKNGNLDDATLDGVYNYFYKKGNTGMLQKLRDKHFTLNASSPIVDSEGKPLTTYHTVQDAYNPNFNVFDTSIEGQHTGIFTTDNKVMSGSYNPKVLSKQEREDMIEAIRQRELKKYKGYKHSDFHDQMIALYSDPKRARKKILEDHGKLLKDIEKEDRQKELYITLDNPVVIEGHNRGWNQVSFDNAPKALQQYPIVETLTNAGPVISTRTVDKVLGGYPEHLPRVGYDGAVFKDIYDYGPNKFISNEFNRAGTVFDMQNPNSLKYRNAITYDNTGKVIPLSQRDNFSSSDLRYGLIPLGIGASLTSNEKSLGGNLYAKGGHKNPTTASNTQRAMSYLLGRGMSRTGASAIIGTLQAESNLDPTIHAKMKGDSGEGIAQWTGSRKKNFWKTLESIEPGAQRRYGSIDRVPLERQLDVILAERPDVTNAIHRAKDISTATDIMLRGYENGGGTIGTMASKGQMDRIYGKWNNGYNNQMKRRLGNASNLLGTHFDPTSYELPKGFFDDISSQVADIPQFQLPEDMDTDPELRYKAPTLDMTLFQQPEETKAMESIYNPQQERLEGLRNFNTVLGLIGQQSPFAALDSGNTGLLDYIGQIYS